MNDNRVKGKAQQAEEQAREALGDVIKKADDTWEQAKDKLDDLDDKIDEMKDKLDRDDDESEDDARQGEARVSRPVRVLAGGDLIADLFDGETGWVIKILEPAHVLEALHPTQPPGSPAA